MKTLVTIFSFLTITMALFLTAMPISRAEVSVAAMQTSALRGRIAPGFYKLAYYGGEGREWE